MEDYNLILDTDGYKPSHFLQFPEGTEGYFGYIEARKAEAVSFGLQMYLKRYLSKPITQENIDEAEEFFIPYGEPFNRKGWEYILNKYDGYIPVEIKAVPEGTIVPKSNVQVTIESTDKNVFWVASYLETALVRMWYPSTVATYSRNCKKILAYYANMSCDEPLKMLNFKLHDFGGRGTECWESSGIGGCSHLVNFEGSDTCVGARFATKYYNAKDPAKSIPASEHGTITPYGKENEIGAYRNMLKQFGKSGAVFACVSDSYNIWDACKMWSNELKQEVINSGAYIVVRPDSGELPETPVKCLNILNSGFGHIINSKGFKVLNNVGVIQGDGMNINSLHELCKNAVEVNKYSLDSLNFGMGGSLIQDHNRDELSYAMKCSATLRDGEWIDAFKSPIGDVGKVSKKGRISLYKIKNGYGCGTKLETLRIEDAKKMDNVEDMLRTVYLNGSLYNQSTFDEVRKRASL